jgi:small subunit ribosomal protein S4
MQASEAKASIIFMEDTVCKKCRRAGQKLFLKGERCFTPKCAIVKKPYPPGVHGKKRRPALSEYGRQLAEKQKLRRIYGVGEKQLKRYFTEAMKSKKLVTEVLLNKLETRLDNVIFRLGWASSRAKARQITSHGHILLNNKRVDIPSIIVKKGDMVAIKKSSLGKPLFKNLETKLKKHKAPSWLSPDKKELKAAILSPPPREEIEVPVDLQMIIEYYSR